MSTVTLAEAAKLTQNLLVQGVIENIVTVNPIYEIFPFMGISGNALSYNRENALGDVQYLGVGGTITAKAPATFTNVTSALTTLIGDAEVNGLIQATLSDQTDQTATQVGSKAKSLARQYQTTMITGTGASNSFSGVLTLVDSSKLFYANNNAANGGVLSFADLDALLDLVTDKDGQVDFIMMNGRTLRSFKELLRALGGASISDVLTLPSGRQVPTYSGVPMFRNDYIPINQTRGATTTCTSVIAGCFDDGSMKHGIVGLTAQNDYGVSVKYVGEKETADESITRVKMYCGMALFSLNGLAVLGGVTN